MQSDEAGPRPECSYDARAGRGSCDWRWEPCCTDGVLLGEMTEDFCVEVTLTLPEGVRRVFVLDGVDSPIERSFGEPIEICGQRVPAVP